MRIKDVVTLKEVVSDLNDGKAFYDQTKSLWADGHFPVFFTGRFAKIDTDFLRIKRCCDYSTTEPCFYLFLLRIKAF